MSDVWSKAERSAIMRLVKSHGNKSTEIKLIEVFQQMGFVGWRRNYPVKGNPDFVFLRKKVAVFADGCFWHGHDCRNTYPKDNEDYWAAKRRYNMRRDLEVTAVFEQRGWTVIRIWECELKKRTVKL